MLSGVCHAWGAALAAAASKISVTALPLAKRRASNSCRPFTQAVNFPTIFKASADIVRSFSSSQTQRWQRIAVCWLISGRAVRAPHEILLQF
jgi:hypothetical protein